jgi:release factor glutamine methyltransferase
VILADAVARLAAAGVASPRTDAELIAAHVLGVARSRLVLVGAFNDAQADAFCSLVERRMRREPLQYLIGSVPFGDVDVLVGPGVFIPRPETELLVAWALGRHLPPAPVIVDLCSGTGAIALAVAHRVPGATVTAVECDPAAVAWLRRNVGARSVAVIEGDVTAASTTSSMLGRVDLLLCNPPYVPDGTPVPPEVADYDPAAAVFAGPDGLDVIRPVVTRAAALLRTGGWVGIEHDDSHETAVVELFRAAGPFEKIRMHRDLAGRPRFTVARRS